MKIYISKDKDQIIVTNKGISTIYYAGWNDSSILEDTLKEFELVLDTEVQDND